MYARMQHVKNCIRFKYARILQLPPWEEHELEELGPNMRREVEREVRLRELVLERLNWDPTHSHIGVIPQHLRVELGDE
jgi:hypothetical protein